MKMNRRRASGPPRQAPGQLDLLGPPAEGWWCDERRTAAGTSRVFVVAEDREVARERADELLRDLGVLPGGPPGLHESFLRMCESARRGRR
jgi:hypothetical protein